MQEREEATPAPEGRGPEHKPITSVSPGGKRLGPLADGPALEALERAAAAIGTDVEGLTNLVVDSGALALPPTDNATEVVTLDELGTLLRSQLSQVAPVGRPGWFAKLSEVQQGAVVVSLRNDHASTHAISLEFGTSPDTVMAIFNDYCDKIGQNVTNVRLTTIVGHMQLVAERAQAGAIQKNDWATFWRVQKELIANLQSLGIVDKAIHKVEVTHKLDERQREHIDRLAQLRMKEQAREEELKLVEAEVRDAEPIPEELELEND